MREVQLLAERAIENVEKVIFGKHEVVQLTLIALLSDGHLLIEDVPGVGKTMLARSLAASIGCRFQRIQFTPDMLPSDLTGVSIYNQKTQEFEFRRGPLMAQIVLIDEINRATPKTQSALLEAMEERQITVDGVTHPLDRPFLVMATENPIEYEGTFPLPEAQLDRFLMRIGVGYPSLEEEEQILVNLRRIHPIEKIGQVVDAEELLALQSDVWDVTVDETVLNYVVRLVRATRDHRDLILGASPRGSLGLYKASQALAAIRGRDFVLPDEVKLLAPSVLGHRLIVRPESALRGRNAQTMLENLLEEVKLDIGEFDQA